MKKLIFIKLMVLVFIAMVIVGCDAEIKATNNIENKEPKNEEKEVNNILSPDIRVIYATGSYDHSIQENIINYTNRGLVYYEIINNKKEFNSIIEKYRLENKKMDKSLNYSDEFFKEHNILIIYPNNSKDSIYYYVTYIEKKGNNLFVDIEKEVLPQNNDKNVNPIILLEMKNKLYNEIKKFKFNIKTELVMTEDFNKNNLTHHDLQLGKLTLGGIEEKIYNMMNQAPMKINEDSKGYEKEFVFTDNTVITLRDLEIAKISVKDPKYLTPRGLKVGDNTEKLEELYGKPSLIKDGIYNYDLTENLYLLQAEVKEGKIVRLQVNLGASIK